MAHRKARGRLKAGAGSCHSREACEDAPRDAEGVLFPPWGCLYRAPRGLGLRGEQRPLGCTAVPPSAPPGRGWLRAPAVGLRLQAVRSCGIFPPRLPHLGAIRMAEGCSKIAVHAHVNLLLSPHNLLLFPQNLMWGTWSSGKCTVRNKCHLWGVAEGPGEGRADPPSHYLYFKQRAPGFGVIRHWSHPRQGSRVIAQSETCPPWAEATAECLHPWPEFAVAVR